MNKKEETILEQKPMINGNMLDVLDRVLDFNNDYLTFLKSQLDTAKAQQSEEMENNG